MEFVNCTNNSQLLDSPVRRSDPSFQLKLTPTEHGYTEAGLINVQLDNTTGLGELSIWGWLYTTMLFVSAYVSRSAKRTKRAHE